MPTEEQRARSREKYQRNREETIRKNADRKRDRYAKAKAEGGDLYEKLKEQRREQQRRYVAKRKQTPEQRHRERTRRLAREEAKATGRDVQQIYRDWGVS